MCRRENIRQKLNIAPEKQFLFFEELFRDFQDDISLETITTYLGIICEIYDPGKIRAFSNHVFLIRSKKNTFSPRYEVLRVYFIARFIAKGLVDKSRDGLIKKLAENSSGTSQVMDWLEKQLKKIDGNRVFAAYNSCI